MTATSAQESSWIAEDAGVLVRSTLFVTVFLLELLTLHPFPSLSNIALLEAWEAGDTLNQIVYISLLAAVLIVASRISSSTLYSLFGRTTIATWIWFAATVIWSNDPDLSVRRLGFVIVVMITAACVLLLPISLRHLSMLLATIAGITLILCYFGVALLPDRSIHQATDYIEPQLHGDWRGFFGHKNGAGAVMTIMIFTGLFVARTLSIPLGVSIATGAFVFLVFSHAKSPLLIFPVVMLVSLLCGFCRSAACKFVIAVTPFIIFNGIGVLGSYTGLLGDIVPYVLKDPSFTGRTDVWNFAIAHLTSHPLTGSGFFAFWRTDDVYLSNVHGIWANRASNSHNGMLDLTLTTGIVGLALVMMLLVVNPVRNFHNCLPLDANRELSTYLFKIAMFGLYLNCFESVAFDRGSVVWFFWIFAVFGLRLSARVPLAM